MDSVIEATSHHQQFYDLKSPSSNEKNPRSKERVLRELKPKHARRAPAPAVDPIAEAKTLLMLRKNTLKAKAKNIQISKAALALKIDAALVFLCATGLVIACLQFEVLKLSHDLSCSSKFHIQCAIAIPFLCFLLNSLDGCAQYSYYFSSPNGCFCCNNLFVVRSAADVRHLWARLCGNFSYLIVL